MSQFSPLASTATLAVGDIPLLAPSDFVSTLSTLLQGGRRLLAYFALPARPLSAGENTGKRTLIAIATSDQDGSFLPVRCEVASQLPSLTPLFPQVQLFERELFEDFGIVFEGHPWLKSVRIPPDQQKDGKSYPFFKTQGREVHEVAVGPVHAGIIEPGHFRFQCFGENVIHLEIALGYQHRGLEKLLLAAPVKKRLPLLECAAGDTSIGHALAHILILEHLSRYTVSERVLSLRTLALELERLANHVGDLGAIAGDTGFLPTSSWNGRIRGDILTMTALITGNRFGRGFITPGCVRYDVSPLHCEELRKRLNKAQEEATGSVQVMLEAHSVRERLDGTGALSQKTAEELGLVGVSARACGLARDARASTPFRKPSAHWQPATAKSGDVLARVLVRVQEMKDSFEMAQEELTVLSRLAEDSLPSSAESWDLPRETLVLSQVEGFRGEIVHVAVTGDDNTFLTYKIIDPSFHNWMGLACALRENHISDFPLCNKSFNLSYCGHDL